jgi:hypothetical protein
MDRILKYMNEATPYAIVNRETGAELTDLKKVQIEATLRKTEYTIASHEWGLAYSSMIVAADATVTRDTQTTLPSDLSSSQRRLHI